MCVYQSICVCMCMRVCLCTRASGCVCLNASVFVCACSSLSARYFRSNQRKEASPWPDSDILPSLVATPQSFLASFGSHFRFVQRHSPGRRRTTESSRVRAERASPIFSTSVKGTTRYLFLSTNWRTSTTFSDRQRRQPGNSVNVDVRALGGSPLCLI